MIGARLQFLYLRRFQAGRDRHRSSRGADPDSRGEQRLRGVERPMKPPCQRRHIERE